MKHPYFISSTVFGLACCPITESSSTVEHYSLTYLGGSSGNYSLIQIHLTLGDLCIAWRSAYSNEQQEAVLITQGWRSLSPSLIRLFECGSSKALALQAEIDTGSLKTIGSNQVDLLRALSKFLFLRILKHGRLPFRMSSQSRRYFCTSVSIRSSGGLRRPEQ